MERVLGENSSQWVRPAQRLDEKNCHFSGTERSLGLKNSKWESAQHEGAGP